MNDFIGNITAIAASMTVVYNEKLPKRKWYARKLTLSERWSQRCPVADAGLDNLAKRTLH